MFKRTLTAVARKSKLYFQDIKPRTLTSKFPDRRTKIALIKPNSLPVFSTARSYAKGKDIKKGKNKKIYIDENELSEFFDIEKLLADLDRPIDLFKQDLTQHATLRSSQSAIESLKVPFAGKIYRIQDLAEIGKKNPKMYVLDMSNFPQAITVVVSVLQNSNLNINVQQDGEKVFVPIPKVTREYREVLAKKSKVFYFKCKESIRDVQSKYMRSLKATENLSDETKFRVTNQLSALKDKYMSMAEDILKEKEYELLQAD